MTLHTAVEEGAPHGHRECSSRERVWLAREHGAPSTVAKHPYCVGCGTVRNLTWPQARPLGYYLTGVATLKEYLERSPLRPKLAQVQTHLITTQLASRLEFGDPYGTPGQAQREAYVRVIRSVRSDLDEELILRLLPNFRGRQRNGALEGEKSSTTA